MSRTPPPPDAPRRASPGLALGRWWPRSRHDPAGPGPARDPEDAPSRPRPSRRGATRGPLPKRPEGVLGIEIARGGLRFVELRRSGGRPELRAHGEIAFGSTEDLGSVLEMVVEHWNVGARDVHVVDSTCRANLKVHRMPDVPESELGAILRGDIESEAELLGEPLVGDWCLLRRAGGEAEVLVGKVPYADREPVAAACRRAGLRLQVLTSSSVLLARHLLALGAVPEGSTVGLLDIGRAKTNMALFTQEHVRLVREVYQGMSASFLRGGRPSEAGPDLDAIGAGLDEVVGTVQQIRRTWQQYRDQNPGSALDRLVVTGETTRISRILGLLQNDLRVPVASWDPAAAAGLDPASLPEDFRLLAPTFAVPWVLATTPADRIALNFAEGVPDPRPLRLARGAAAAAAIGLVGCAIALLVDGRTLDRTEEALAAVDATKAELEVELGLLEEVRWMWNDWVAGAVQGVGLPPHDVRPHLVELVRALPPGLRLTRVAFGRDAAGWRLDAEAIAVSAGATASHAEMQRFVEALSRSPLVEDVRMLPLDYERRADRRGEERLTFALTAAMRLVGGATIADAADPGAPSPAAAAPDAGGTS